LKILTGSLQNKILLRGDGCRVANEIYAVDLRHTQFMEKNKTISDEIKLHSILGREYLEVRAFRLAEKEFKKVLKMDSSNVSALWSLADIYDCQGKWESSVENLKLMIAAYPSFIDAYDLLWKTYWHARKNKLALEVIKMELKLDPTREGLRRILRTGLPSVDEKDLFDKVLEYDLENIIKVANARRIKVILQSYPFDDRNDEIRKKVARKWRILFIDNREPFMKLKSTDNYNHENYFVEDGHCNANGYYVIAENIKKTLMTEIEELLE